jgi:hypothetical protein
MVPGGPCHEFEGAQMSDYKLLIDGKLVSGTMALNVVNPATEEVVAVACARATTAALIKPCYETFNIKMKAWN